MSLHDARAKLQKELAGLEREIRDKAYRVKLDVEGIRSALDDKAPMPCYTSIMMENMGRLVSLMASHDTTMKALSMLPKDPEAKTEAAASVDKLF